MEIGLGKFSVKFKILVSRYKRAFEICYGAAYEHVGEIVKGKKIENNSFLLAQNHSAAGTISFISESLNKSIAMGKRLRVIENIRCGQHKGVG